MRACNVLSYRVGSHIVEKKPFCRGNVGLRSLPSIWARSKESSASYRAVIRICDGSDAHHELSLMMAVVSCTLPIGLRVERSSAAISVFSSTSIHSRCLSSQINKSAFKDYACLHFKLTTGRTRTGKQATSKPEYKPNELPAISIPVENPRFDHPIARVA